MSASIASGAGRGRRSRGHAPGQGVWGNRVGLAIVTVLVLLPFLWMISLAFTPERDAFRSAALIPAHPTLDNFVTAFVGADLGRAMLNSFAVAGVTVLSNGVFAVLAGYAFAMFRFPGSRVLLYLLISTSAIPSAVTLIPLFLMTRQFPLVGGNDLFGHGGSGLLNTLPGLMLPYLVMPLNIFLARQFFLSAPTELAEAARIDGAGEIRIFSRVYLPLARPLLAVVAITTFTGVWDDFLWPLVTTTSTQMQTAQLALTRFLANGNIQYGALMAGTVIVSLPVIVVFLLNQRSFISGLADGSIKG